MISQRKRNGLEEFWRNEEGRDEGIKNTCEDKQR
ncbi:unnamed protein product [Arabidopsis halleri]